MKLFYRKYGSGPPLFILHGLFGSSDNWSTIAKKLADTFTVYLPDLRNHGQSPHSEIHNYDSMRDDMYELVTSLSIDKFLLAGHSMGGKVAISFALKWPEMLNGLLIADISPFKDGTEDRSEYKYYSGILNTMLSIDLREISSRSEVEKALKKTGLPEYITGFILKNLRRTEGNNFEWKINAPSLLNNLNFIMKGIDRKNVFSNQVTGFPVIFLKGKNSDYLPPEDYYDILKIFPAAEFVEIGNAGHWIHSDNPDEVERNIRKLLIG